MLSTYFKKLLMILIVSSFTSSSFAAWSWNKNVTHCRGSFCQHDVVHKKCYNGHCYVYKHKNDWRR